MHVLIVDDDATNLELAGLILKHLNYVVTVCCNGKQAIDLCIDRGISYDLIVMDMVMPEMDGGEAIRALRSHRRTRNVPVLCVSANAANHHREDGLDAGCDHYLTKPYRREQLIAAIEKTLTKRPRQPSGLTVLVVEDDAQQMELIQGRLEALGAAILAATTPEEGRRLAIEHQPDLALVDLKLGDSVDSGLSLIRELKADARTAGIPVVVHSLYADEHPLEVTNARLPKPFTINQLADLLTELRVKVS